MIDSFICPNCGTKLPMKSKACPICSDSFVVEKSPPNINPPESLSLNNLSTTTKILLTVGIPLFVFYLLVSLPETLSFREADRRAAAAAENTRQQQSEPLKPKLTPAEQAAVAIIGKKPVQSEWDGVVKPVVDYLKSNLNDPYSVKYDEWSPVVLLEYEGEKYWSVRVKFRAKNAFGGYILHNQVFFMRNSKVVNVMNY